MPCRRPSSFSDHRTAHPAFSIAAPLPPRGGSEVVDDVAAEGAGVLAAALEPLVEAAAVEEVAARAAALVRHPPVAAHHAVADRALRLPLQRPHRVAPERCQPVDDAAALFALGDCG